MASTFNDLLLLGANALHIVGVLLLIAFCCWRGARLSLSARLFQSELESETIVDRLRIGLGILLVVIVLRALNHTHADELALVLLVPIFLLFVLLTHALSQIIVVRRSHLGRLQGSVRTQEKSLLSIIVVIGLMLLLVAFLINNITGSVSTYIGTWLLWLLQLLQLHPKPPPPPRKIVKFPKKIVTAKSTPNDALLLLIAHITEVVLLVLVVVVIVATVYWLFRRRRITIMRSKGEKDEGLHESLWSWKLFWMQVRAFFAHLSFPLFSVHRKTNQRVMREERLAGEPSVRSIREIYCALLRWSAARGIVRKQAETPYEFRARLHSLLPLIEPELNIVTEAYTETRYGVVVPGEDEVVRVREAWRRLQQK